MKNRKGNAKIWWIGLAETNNNKYHCRANKYIIHSACPCSKLLYNELTNLHNKPLT